MEIVVDRWNAFRKEDVLVPLQQVSDAVLGELHQALQAPLRRHLQDFNVNSSGLCFKEAGNFVDDAQLRRGDRQLRLVQVRACLNKLGLSQPQAAKGAASCQRGRRLSSSLGLEHRSQRGADSAVAGSEPGASSQGRCGVAFSLGRPL